jgi:hypothetical protein
MPANIGRQLMEIVLKTPVFPKTMRFPQPFTDIVT